MRERGSEEARERGILAIETATSVCSVALLIIGKPPLTPPLLRRGGRILAERSEVTNRMQDERLPVLVKGVLDDAGVTPDEISYIAVSIGPGSFTGLRVGLSFAKGFAAGVGAQIVPVGTLEALAGVLINHRDTEAQRFLDSVLCPLVVARKGEAFGQLFRKNDDFPELLSDAFICNVETLEAQIEGKSAFIGGEGADMLLNDNEELRTPHSALRTHIPNLRASAVKVGRIALNMLAAGFEPPKVRDITPLYLKEFTIKRTYKDAPPLSPPRSGGEIKAATPFIPPAERGENKDT